MDVHQRQRLQDTIVATLGYFDLFDHPLTLQELHRYLYRHPSEEDGGASLSDILSALDDPAFEEVSGFYFFSGRRSIVATRQRRFRLAERKFRKAVRFACFARFLPSVRMISVCNSLAYANAENESDIDLFIVTKAGTLWVTRFILAGILALFDLRPRKGKEADMFCVSFSVTENALDVGQFMLHDNDIYLTYWAATLLPIYDPDCLHESFIAVNARLFRDVPRARSPRQTLLRSVSRAPRWTRIFLSLLEFFEYPTRNFQKKHFPSAIRELANKDTRVVITDDVLKFHVLDRRAHYAEAYRERVETHLSRITA